MEGAPQSVTAVIREPPAVVATPEFVTARITDADNIEMPNIEIHSPPPPPPADLTATILHKDQNHFHQLNDHLDHLHHHHHNNNNNNNTINTNNNQQQRRRSSFGSGSSSASPDTEEFESLERRLTAELQEKLAQRRQSGSSQRRLSDEFSILSGTSSDRRISTTTSSDSSERKYSYLSDRKSSERKLSELSDGGVGAAAEDELSLQLIEKRQLRSFSRADEYLYAMKVSYNFFSVLT